MPEDNHSVSAADHPLSDHPLSNHSPPHHSPQMTPRRSPEPRRSFLSARRVPFAVWALLAYLAAITIFGKGPTYLGYPPLYWGEVVLGLGLLWILSSNGATGLGNRQLRPLSAAVLLFVAYGAVRTCISFSEWGLDAWRDAAVWYYAGFYFIGIHIARLPPLGDKIWRAVCGFWVAALLWGVAETLSGNAFSALSPVIPWRGVPVLSSSHSDLMQNMALGSILVLCVQRAKRSPLWGNLLYVVAVAGFAMFLLSYGRGVKVGLGLGILCVIALNLRALNLRALNLRGFNLSQFRSVQLPARLYRLLFVSGLVLILVVAALGLGITDVGSLSRFDLGFGENLGIFNPYIDAHDSSGWPIRAPHNVNVTVLSRMGFFGFAIWLAILGRGLGGLFLRVWRSGAGTRADSSASLRPARTEEISFWLLMLLTTWGNGSFGVLMEGPVLGVWFWFALGFSSVCSLALRGAPAAVRSPRRSYALPRLTPAAGPAL